MERSAGDLLRFGESSVELDVGPGERFSEDVRPTRRLLVLWNAAAFARVRPGEVILCLEKDLDALWRRI